MVEHSEVKRVVPHFVLVVVLLQLIQRVVLVVGRDLRNHYLIVLGCFRQQHRVPEVVLFLAMSEDQVHEVVSPSFYKAFHVLAQLCHLIFELLLLLL